jgi:phospholipid transport system substrate-binding protein
MDLIEEVPMSLSYVYRRIVLILLFIGMAVPAVAGEPTEKIRQTTDKILSILGNEALRDPSRAKERRRLIRSAIDERFDWEEMARRSLATHWAKRTPEEKKEFVRLFSDLLERAYMSKIEEYSGEKVRYEGEVIDGEYAVVKVNIATKKSKDIPVEYRLKKERNDWFVYDVSIEGVSLVNNYRTQFNSIILESTYENLVKKMKEKLAQK